MKTFFVALFSWNLSKQLSQLHCQITVCHCCHWNIEGTAAFVKTININTNISNNKKIRFKFDENCSCELWQWFAIQFGTLKKPMTCNNLIYILYIIHFKLQNWTVLDVRDCFDAHKLQRHCHVFFCLYFESFSWQNITSSNVFFFLWCS